ncbi:MAG: helix-turn-helix domain containing protein [Acidimicrobiales bacterium]|nr:helix-turn-helix domain containing protein [Acidimicrobiales bacterium]
MSATDTGTSSGNDQRTRILDAALELMGDQGASTTSMRQLAGACDINVATLYHYFPSKSDLLRAVIEERAYSDELASMIEPPVARRGGPSTRLASLLAFIAGEALATETVWRLFLGEAVHSNADAMAMARQLSSELEIALERWIPDLLPEFDGDVAALARLLRGQLFSMMIEVLVSPDLDRNVLVHQRASELAGLVLGQ